MIHQRTGLVYQLVVGPMDGLLHYLGLHLNHNYGLAIVIIVPSKININATHVA